MFPGKQPSFYAFWGSSSSWSVLLRTCPESVKCFSFTTVAEGGPFSTTIQISLSEYILPSGPWDNLVIYSHLSPPESSLEPDTRVGFQLSVIWASSSCDSHFQLLRFPKFATQFSVCFLVPFQCSAVRLPSKSVPPAWIGLHVCYLPLMLGGAIQFGKRQVCCWQGF